MTTIQHYIEIDLEELIDEHEHAILEIIEDRKDNSGVIRSVRERLDLIEKQINNIRYDTEKL